MIEFSCPKCGRKMRVTETAAGKRGRCKNCDASVVVPVAGESNVGATEQALYQAVLRTASPVLSQGVACDAFPDAGRGSNAVPIASRSDHEFDKHQKIGLWLAGGGLLVVCISPFFKWVNFGAGGVSGLAVDGKIVLAATVIAAIAYWWSVARGRWRVPLFLLVQSWGTLVVIWMAKLIGQTTPSLDAPEVKDNPFAVLMASQVGPGAGLYLGLVGGIAVAGGLGFVAVRCLFPVGRLKLFYAIQSTSCLLGLLLAVLVSPDARSKHTDDSHQSGNKEVAREDAAKDNDDKGNPIADPWETATTVAEDEVVRVEVENVAIEKLRTRSILGKENTSKDDWVIVTLRISNKTDAQKITYRSWGESSFDSHSKLQDDLGNKYSPSYDHDIVGRTTIESVYPGKSVTDLLAFEIPVTKAKFLKLTLPKSKCDAGEGELLLKIPMPRQRISEEKLLPPLEKGGRPDAKAKMNQAAIDVGAEPPDEVLTILVADQGYAVRRITAEVAGYFPAEFDDLIRLARNAKPNDAGVRVRILRSESAKVAAWQKLQAELVQAGVPAEAIVLAKDLVKHKVDKPDLKPPNPQQVVDPWERATDKAIEGSFIVRISDATIGKVSLKGFSGNGTSKENLLKIQLRLTNDSPNRKINYAGWSATNGAFLHAATLTDNFGNSYKRIDFGIGTDVVGQKTNESILPNTRITDLLVFEAPVKNATVLMLELPKRAIDGDDDQVFRLKFPCPD